MSSADDCSIPSIGIDAWYDEAYPPMTTLSATAPCLLSPIRHPGDCLYVPSSPTSVDDGVSSTVPPSSTLATHSSVNFQPTGLVLRDTSRSPPTLTPPNSDRHAQDYVNDLLATWERRRPLLSMLMVDSNRQEQFSKFRKELGKIEAQIGTNLTLILQSQDARREARQLTGSNGQVLIDAIQDVRF
ncbi:hypothetical protein C8R45DRAFT_995528 [Mycena sanguinolenta]|nr:hypothetical protein C8R45DRAFT_995528 [Mycena sanguinolenta]